MSAHPISFLGCVMKQIQPADSAYFAVFLGQALFRDRQGIMGRNTTDERLSYLPFSSTFTIIRRVPMYRPGPAQGLFSLRVFSYHCCLLKGQALGFFNTSRDKLDCECLFLTTQAN